MSHQLTALEQTPQEVFDLMAKHRKGNKTTHICLNCGSVFCSRTKQQTHEKVVTAFKFFNQTVPKSAEAIKQLYLGTKNAIKLKLLSKEPCIEFHIQQSDEITCLRKRIEALEDEKINLENTIADRDAVIHYIEEQNAKAELRRRDFFDSSLLFKPESKILCSCCQKEISNPLCSDCARTFPKGKLIQAEPFLSNPEFHPQILFPVETSAEELKKSLKSAKKKEPEDQSLNDSKHHMKHTKASLGWTNQKVDLSAKKHK